MDASINKPMKDQMRKRFLTWYADNVRTQLEKGTLLEDVKVDMALSAVKNHSTNWMIQSWEAFSQRSEIAVNGIEKAGVLPGINSVTD